MAAYIVEGFLDIRFLIYCLSPLVLGGVILVGTRIFTTLRYRREVAVALNGSSQRYTPPHVPYTIPLLGNALSFLDTRPGLFWNRLLSWYPRETGACTLMLGGRPFHIVFHPVALEALFKNRELSRDGFIVDDIAIKGLGLEPAMAKKFFRHGDTDTTPMARTGRLPQEMHSWMNQDFILKSERVNELTAQFARLLREHLADDLDNCPPDGRQIKLNRWLRGRMFHASTDMLLGSSLLKEYPELEEDFFEFDRHFLSLFFGLPSILNRKAHSAREKVFAGIIRWQNKMEEAIQQGGKFSPAEGKVDWEPIFGSRANRVRQFYYRDIGIDVRTRAGLDAGFLIGITSNSTPAAGWILMNILDPSDKERTLYHRVRAELDQIRRPSDGLPDIPRLLGLPLLNSIFQETLRLYVDVLVTRNVKEPLLLPVDNGRQLYFPPGGLLISPSWPTHRDSDHWTGPPADQFYPDRFLTPDPDTGKLHFSTSQNAGKMFPFGGGKTVCPGRVFSKHEIFVTIAYILLNFDFDVLGCVNGKGSPTSQFPSFRNSYPGSTVVVAEGDIRVTMRKREY
ncbi:hypothetical protein EMCG_07392 [[Emmonsia] crescens]|uniref:Cytochrome P450 n=1 Tax=[Emmonsia] crescens TaxID=73230 RepID=A0A0G2JB56_9EURO|nr:hypothetical protein EMCG_07392 [Emmonsia crescens UAMH 3008]